MTKATYDTDFYAGDQLDSAHVAEEIEGLGWLCASALPAAVKQGQRPNP
jgi:hypothetical protein